MTETKSVTWRHDGDIMPDGDVGGDGAGESVSICYLTDDAPNARVVSYYYVVDTFERGGIGDDDDVDVTSRYVVESMTELRVADTDADTDGWTDYEYGEGSDFAYATEDEATAARDAMARREYTLGARLCIAWDGQPY